MSLLTERSEEMFRLRGAGLSYGRLGQLFGLSAERCRQIVKRHELMLFKLERNKRITMDIRREDDFASWTQHWYAIKHRALAAQTKLADDPAKFAGDAISSLCELRQFAQETMGHASRLRGYFREECLRSTRLAHELTLERGGPDVSMDP